MGIKAIIPVAGAGTKLRPHTYTQPKALIPMAGKTILSVIVDSLLENGVEEFVFIVGYLGEKIQDYIGRHYPNLKCTFVTQNDRCGTGHAIWLAKDAVGDDEVLIVYGDTICDYNVQEVIQSPTSLIALRRVEDPRSFGVAELGADDQILKLVEKPVIPKSNLAIVGIYKIKESKQLFAILDDYVQKQAFTDGEYHLTIALQYLIDQGVPFKGYRVNNWFDCGRKETLLITNATLLNRMKNQVNNNAEAFLNSVIIPPVNIAPGCIVESSIIGPNVSIGENTKVSNAVIQNSIIGSFAKLEDIVLKSSIIGSDAYIRGVSQSLNIGDNTNIDLSCP